MSRTGQPSRHTRGAVSDWLGAVAVAAAVWAAAYLGALAFDWGGRAGSGYAFAYTLWVATGPALGLPALWVLARRSASRPLGNAASVAVLTALCYGLVWAVVFAVSPILAASHRGQPGDAGSMDGIVALLLGALAAPLATAAVALLVRRRLRLAGVLPGALLGLGLVAAGLQAYLTLRPH
jgi:hypothetical protein